MAKKEVKMIIFWNFNLKSIRHNKIQKPKCKKYINGEDSWFIWGQKGSKVDKISIRTQIVIFILYISQKMIKNF